MPPSAQPGQQQQACSQIRVRVADICTNINNNNRSQQQQQQQAAAAYAYGHLAGGPAHPMN